MQGFFRRMMKEQLGWRSDCTRGGRCEVSANNRNVCRRCRYEKCILVGMRQEGSRIGRQPNAIKHATLLEATMRQQHAHNGAGAGGLGFPVPGPLRHTASQRHPHLVALKPPARETGALDAGHSPAADSTGTNKLHNRNVLQVVLLTLGFSANFSSF